MSSPLNRTEQMGKSRETGADRPGSAALSSRHVSTSTRADKTTTDSTAEPDATPQDVHVEAESGLNEPPMEAAARASAAAVPKRTFMERADAFVSKLSSKNNFWHRVTSLIFLPYAFRSGIRMKRKDERTFAATLPFTRYNKNWYNAMAGAALLGNTEIAGGMYVFGFCGGDYTVVCKHLEYKFLRPCFGPAEYRITPKEDIEALIATGGEFNITIQMDVVQTLPTMVGNKVKREAKKARKAKRKSQVQAAEGAAAITADGTTGAGKGSRPVSREERLERLKKREKRVGRAFATFHVTPKAHHKAKALRKAEATQGD